MKRIPVLLTLMFCAIFSALFSAKTQALYKDEDGVVWWSVEDLLEFSEVADAEEEELCGEDLSCREELFYSRFESEDERYTALNMLKEGRFWVASVNPTEETLEVLYFDEDEWLKRWGIEEHQPLDFIFLAWFEQINGQIGNYNHYLPIEPQFSDDLHLVYADSSESYDINNGFPANKPFKLPINNTNIIDNSLGRLYIAVFGENFNSKGYTDYSSCLTDYKEGETCELMFSPGRGYNYFPLRKTTIENEPSENTIIENTESDEIEHTELIISQETTEDKSNLEPQTVTEETLKPVSPFLIKAPNTGSYTNLCEKTIEFPWWFGGILLLGNITALWLFLPQKSQKISKKSLDNFNKVR